MSMSAAALFVSIKRQWTARSAGDGALRRTSRASDRRLRHHDRLALTALAAGVGDGAPEQVDQPVGVGVEGERWRVRGDVRAQRCHRRAIAKLGGEALVVLEEQADAEVA